ncbi:MAG: HD domain-containing protein [Deltaproteobacteria bacterium]|nr:HD domain-containing protein [Deltaproteobacteria bacterium]
MALPGGNFTLTLTLEPLAQSDPQPPELISLNDLSDLFSSLLDSLSPDQRQGLNLSPPPTSMQENPAGLFYWANSIMQRLGRVNSGEDFYMQLLRLVVKITKVRQAAFFGKNGNGRLRLLASLDRQNLPHGYLEAAKEVVQNGAPLLFTPRGQEKSPPILAVPLAQEGSLSGVLLLGDRPDRPLDRDDLNLVTMLAENPSLVSDNLALHEKNTISLLESIKALVRSLEARDPYTGQHSSRVTEIVSHFGRHLGMPPVELELLKTASYLHDIGKVGISDFILLKPGPLTPEERGIIETHPLIGGKIVEPLGLRTQEKDVILYHHERWDGRGYPRGLAGKEIPFVCRLLTLADVYDALTTDRPYRRRCSIPEALTEIRAHAGTQFDPELTLEFVDMLSTQTA